ncbi:hypothetical protein BDD12DRAFT_828858 [Trichophaea hybrida]|nr:hypothetical protein BDD12DRAFT_828858 [Trichophaea hybrida]
MQPVHAHHLTLLSSTVQMVLLAIRSLVEEVCKLQDPKTPSVWFSCDASLVAIYQIDQQHIYQNNQSPQHLRLGGGFVSSHTKDQPRAGNFTNY